MDAEQFYYTPEEVNELLGLNDLPNVLNQLKRCANGNHSRSYRKFFRMVSQQYPTLPMQKVIGENIAYHWFVLRQIAVNTSNKDVIQQVENLHKTPPDQTLQGLVKRVELLENVIVSLLQQTRPTSKKSV